MKKTGFILLVLLLSFECFSQDTSNSGKAWRLMNLSGEMNIKGLYREKETTLGNISESQKSTYLSGGLLFNSRSYIWHPDFLQLDVGANYNPGTRQEDYLVSPDFSEVSSMQKLNIGATLFSNKKVTLGSYADFSQSIQNRENLTNVKSNNKIWGGSVILRNKYVPLTVNYSDSKWEQEELQTGRIFNIEKKTLEGKIIKSFTRNDRHELSYTHDENKYKNVSLLQIDNTTENKIDRVRLVNNIFLDSLKNYNIRSIISNYNQIGTYDLQRFQVFENVTLKLPENLTFISGYDYFNLQQEAQELQQHRIRSDLKHQLYLSLKSGVFFEYTDMKHTIYDAFNYKGGFFVRYDKEIPADGRFSLSYQYYRYHDDMDSDPVALNVRHEEHILTDGELELLKKPYIDSGTVVVKDVTGTIVYQLDFDYILVEMNDFIEIRRFPGGQIANGGTVYVDYIAIQPGAYNYDADNHTINASVSFFSQFVEVYYKRRQQNYVNIEQAEFLTLNYYTQNVIGTRINVDFGSAGIEYDHYESTIIPYQMIRYYIQLQKNFKNKLLASLHGNVRDYIMLNNVTDQTYTDISSRIAYQFKSQTKLSLDVGYRNQAGQEIDLDLFTARCEFTTLVRQLYFTLGLEAYRRNYLSESVNFNGAYVRISRRFKYS